MPTTRLALVFSGGGAKGAFGAGVLTELVARLPGFHWEVVAGTSTGALITPFAVLGRDDPQWLTDLSRFYVTAHRDTVAKPLSLFANICGGAKGLSSLEPLAKLLQTVFPPRALQTLASSPVPGIITAVNLQRGRLCLCTQDSFSNGIHQWYKANALAAWGMVPDLFPFDRFLDVMVASSAVPFVSEPIVLDDCQYVDGGVFDKAPLRAALAAGATHAVVIMMSPPPGDPKEPKIYDSLLSIGMRSIDLLQEEVARGDLEALEKAEEFLALREKGAIPQGFATRSVFLEYVLPYAAIGQTIRFAVVDPELPLGDTMDFDRKVREGWPMAPNDGKKMRIMEARFEYGRRRTAALLADPTSQLCCILRECGLVP